MSETIEKRFSELKREVKDATREAERAQGALDETIKQLKDEFDCSSLKEAKALLGKLEKKANAAEDDFETALAEYEAEWNSHDDLELEA